MKSEEARIDDLRLKAFKTNDPIDRKAYFEATSKWFQDRHYREISNDLEENILFLLKDDPDVIRCREGGGEESLIASLVLTMYRTRNTRDSAINTLKNINNELRKGPTNV